MQDGRKVNPDDYLCLVCFIRALGERFACRHRRGKSGQIVLDQMRSVDKTRLVNSWGGLETERKKWYWLFWPSYLQNDYRREWLTFTLFEVLIVSLHNIAYQTFYIRYRPYRALGDTRHACM